MLRRTHLGAIIGAGVSPGTAVWVLMKAEKVPRPSASGKKEAPMIHGVALVQAHYKSETDHESINYAHVKDLKQVKDEL